LNKTLNKLNSKQQTITVNTGNIDDDENDNDNRNDSNRTQSKRNKNAIGLKAAHVLQLKSNQNIEKPSQQSTHQKPKYLKEKKTLKTNQKQITKMQTNATLNNKNNNNYYCLRYSTLKTNSLKQTIFNNSILPSYNNIINNSGHNTNNGRQMSFSKNRSVVDVKQFSSNLSINSNDEMDTKASNCSSLRLTQENSSNSSNATSISLELNENDGKFINLLYKKIFKYHLIKSY
jgi:hypothetical protein